MRKLPATLKKFGVSLRKNRKRIFPIALGILLIAIPLVYFLNRQKETVGADWWSGQENGSSWAKRQQVTITNNSSVTLSAGTTVAILVDTKALASQGYIKSDCSDLRVVYASSGTTNTEVTRNIVYEANKTCATSSATKIYFKLQADQNTTTTKDNNGYYVYYSNAQASVPTGTEAAFALTGATATLVCPFNGSTTCATGETNTAGTPGAIRTSGSKTALSLSGYDTATFGLSENAWSTAPGLINLPYNDMTVEAWIYWDLKTATGADVAISKRGSPAVGWRWELSNDSNNLTFRVGCSTTDAQFRTAEDTIPYNQWTHIATTWDPKAKTAKIYINGTEATYNLTTACVGNYVDDTANTFYVGRDNEVNQHFPGKIDELRISNAIRYAGNFTTTTSPFIRDSLTKLLYHFDENGRLPQGSGTHFIYDDSGNGYNAVLNGGNYVEGLVGKDKSDSEAGYVSGSYTYAGKEGIYLEDTTTNKIPNPSFESDGYTLGWTISGGTTSPSTTATLVKFGSKAAAIIANDTTNRNLYTSVTTGGGTHTLSAYVYRYSSNLSGTVDNTVAQLFFNNAAQSTTVYQNIGGGWWRLSYTGTANATDNFGVTLVEDSGVIVVDAVQLEATNLLTSYTDGSLGSNYSWSGTPHNSTSTRTVTSLTYPTAGNISNTAGSVSLWIKMPIANTTYSTSSYNTIFATQEDATGDWFEIRYDRYTNSFVFMKFLNYSATTATVAKTYTANEWIHLIATWSTTSGISLRVNNGTAATNANTTMPDGFGTNLYVGGSYHDASEWHTQFTVSDFRIFNAPLSSTQITDLYNAGLVSQSQKSAVDRFTNSKGPGPVAIWHFDEGFGTTANDSSKNLNHLTLASSSAPSWDTMSDPANNALSRNLKFNGNGTYAYRNQDNDFNFGSDSFTISGWFRHISSAPTSNQFVISSHNTAGYKVYMKATTGVMCFGIDGDSTWSPADEACSTSSYYDSKWHSFTAVKNGTSAIYMYVDGTQAGSDTSLSANGSLNNSSKLYVGIDSDGTSGTWYGNLDDIQIDNYALSAEQVRAGTIGDQTAIKLGNMPEDTISEGLVGYWKMDESMWSSTPGVILDYSGNGNHGFSSGSTAAAGKFGNGGVQNSSSDYVNVGSGSSLDNLPSWTYAIWVKPTSISANDILMTKTQSSISNAVRMATGSSGEIWANMGESGTDTFAQTSTTIATNVWTHVAATYDKTQNKIRIYFNGVEQPYSSNIQSADTLSPANDAANDFTIGNRIPTSDEAFIGTYDEARVYNRALSENELKILASWAPGPVAHFKLDEGSGSTVNDSSGSNIISKGMGTPTWVDGVHGQALHFNGTPTDYVDFDNYSVMQITGSMTISMWWKLDKEPGEFDYMTAISKNDVDNDVDFRIQKTAYRNFGFDFAGSSAETCDFNTLFQPHQWYFISVSFDDPGNLTTLYVNGEIDNTCAETASPPGNSNDMTIGEFDNGWAGPGSVFPGALDDIRIYNYARKYSEVVSDMNAGHPTPGSPIGSALGHYKFDDIRGSTVYDSGTGNNNGTKTANVTWNSNGKFDKALHFNGAGSNTTASYVALVDDSYNSLSEGTVSLWFKPDDSGDDIQEMFSVTDGSPSFSRTYEINYVRSANTINIWAANLGTVLDVNYPVPDPQTSWHHVVVAVNSSGHKVYIDGKEVTGTFSTGSATATIFFNTISASTLYYSLGCGRDDTGCYDDELYEGLIDELLVYSSALSASQVGTLYNQGQALAIGSGSVDSSGTPSNAALDKYCPPGETSTCVAPLLELTFDENTGTSNYDNVSGAYTATFAGTPTPKWEQSCVHGSCLGFSIGNSTYQKTEIADTDDSLDFEANEDFTFSFYIKAKDDISENAMQIANGGGGGTPGYQFRASSTAFSCAYRDASNEDLATVTSGHKDGIWRHVACVMDRDGSETGLAGYHIYIDGILKASDTSLAATTTGATFSAPLSIGNYSSDREIGSTIDELRIYNYARSPRQVSWDYNKGGPFIYYTFDECTGTVIHNTAQGLKGRNLGLDATANITATTMATTHNTTAGSCDGATSTAWYNGQDGKYGASLYLDSTDEYLTLGDSDTLSFGNGTYDRPFSAAAWIYTDELEATGGEIFSKHNSSDLEYRFYTTTNEALCIGLNDDSTSGTLQKCTPDGVIVPGTWQHVAFTYDATESLNGLNLYVDTELQDVGSTTFTGYTAMENLTVGATMMGRFVASVVNEYQGKIDEFRMFNYQLTAEQIKNIYNKSAAVVFD